MLYKVFPYVSSCFFKYFYNFLLASHKDLCVNFHMGQRIEQIWTKLKVAMGRASYKGVDTLGNRYYEARTSKGYVRRWVLFSGKPEPSKIPPMWHGWLHYTLEAFPDYAYEYPWQKAHRPNLTGTVHAYTPTNTAPSQNYQPWVPK